MWKDEKMVCKEKLKGTFGGLLGKRGQKEEEGQRRQTSGKGLYCHHGGGLLCGNSCVDKTNNRLLALRI